MSGSPSNRCAGCGWADPQGSFRCPGARRSGVVRCDGPCAALRSGAGLGHTLWGTPRLPTSALCEALPHEGCALLLCPPGKGLLTGLFAPCPHQGGATAEGHSLWPRRSRVGGRDPGRFLHETVGSPAPGAMLWVVSDAPRPKRVVL